MDNVMHVWQVKDQSGTVNFTCARKEIADYLRSWCEADEYDRFLDSSSLLRGVYPHVIPMMAERLDKFYVSESEVIL